MQVHTGSATGPILAPEEGFRIFFGTAGVTLPPGAPILGGSFELLDMLFRDVDL